MACALLVSGCGPKLGKAAWVVRDQLTDSANIKALCEETRAAGLDTLVVQVRGRGDAYYTTTLAPRAENLSPQIEEGDDAEKAARTVQDFPQDPLGEVVANCTDQRLIAWLNVYYLWGGEEPPKAPEHPANAKPEWVLTDADGRSVAEYTMEERAKGWIEGIYADPASKEYRSHFAQIAAEVAERYPVEGIHLDFVRYPGPAYGQGGVLGIRFRSRYGFDPRWLSAQFGTIDVSGWLTEDESGGQHLITTAKLLWADLRAEEITALVREVRSGLDSVRPGVELSAAVVPDAHAAFVEKGQDWRTWLAEGLLDAVYPMAYFGLPERVGAQLESVAGQVRALAPETKLWAGLGAYIKEPQVIAREARIAASLGYDGICLFDFGTLREGAQGLMPFTRAINRSKGRGKGKGKPTPVLPGTLTAADFTANSTANSDANSDGAFANPLERAVVRASKGGEALPANWRELVAKQWSSYEGAGRATITRALTRMENEGVQTPSWRELRGVFRYIHPDDPPGRKAEQLALCEEARTRIAGGEAMEAVAAELSQGGTRKQGGYLGRRYLGETNPYDIAIFPVALGQLSPVLETSNGCWVYRVEGAAGPLEAALSATPWEVRRRFFADELDRQFELDADKLALSAGEPTVVGAEAKKDAEEKL
jgi:uncharacterized lipoprotein YddW (UPF0748 family)